MAYLVFPLVASPLVVEKAILRVVVVVVCVGAIQDWKFVVETKSGRKSPEGKEKCIRRKRH